MADAPQGEEVVIQDRSLRNRKLACPICQNNRFGTRATLLNTRGLTFFDLDWLNQDATNYVCTERGHILWFMGRRA